MTKENIRKVIVIFGSCLMAIAFGGLFLSLCQKDANRQNTPVEEQRMKDLTR